MDSPFLGRFGQFTLLSYLVECWLMFRFFEQAEETGAFGPYADFDPSWVVALRPNGRGVDWPYAVDLPVRLRILELYKAGRLPEPIPRHGRLRTHGDDAQVAAYVLLRLPKELYLLAESSLLAFRFRTGRAPFELAEELAVLELGVLLDAYLRGEPVAVDSRAVDALRERTRGTSWTHDGLVVDGS